MGEIFSTGNPFVQLFIAAALGAFLGLRREMDAQKLNKEASFMGLRTMTLLSFFGAFSTHFPQWQYLPFVFFGIITLFVLIAYVHGSFQMQRIGMTTELSALLAFWIGVLIGLGQEKMAIILTIFLAIIQGYKDALHRFAKTLSPQEWIGALELFTLSGAVLPFLPKTPIDPWGIFVPFNVWFLVILISGIGFVGYFLIKYLGARGGIPLIGFLGAIVSSTAVTISMASQSKKSKILNILMGGILIASATMQLRVIGEIYFLGPQGFWTFLLVPLVMSIVSFILAGYFFFRRDKSNNIVASQKEALNLSSPFELGPALKFGIAFVVILFALALGKKYIGDSGVYVTSILSGVIDVDAIVLSALESVKLGELSIEVARNAIAFAIFMNTLIKVVYVAILGTKELAKKMAISVVFITLAGAVVLFLI
ncbi:MgtC/SapB family protein [Candidatus Gracilibacteria bacterium]|nr:MgtC/SapB family protein [Candidatus Gracilibacteria bacterium]